MSICVGQEDAFSSLKVKNFISRRMVKHVKRKVDMLSFKVQPLLFIVFFFSFFSFSSSSAELCGRGVFLKLERGVQKWNYNLR